MSDTTMDPKAIAQAVAVTVSDEDGQVGDFVEAIDLGDNVTDFRFESRVRGYEGWQWSVTLYHDVELDHWTVNESSLVPTDKALRPPKWIPSARRRMPKDRTIRTTNRQSRMKPYRNRRWMETLRMSLRRRTFRRIPNSL